MIYYVCICPEWDNYATLLCVKNEYKVGDRVEGIQHGETYGIVEKIFDSPYEAIPYRDKLNHERAIAAKKAKESTV